MSGYQPVVQEAWSKPVHESCPIKNLITKMQRMTKAFKAWNKSRIGNTKLQLDIGLELVFQLNQVQKTLILTTLEKELRSCLKARILGLAAIERLKWRHRSQITWLMLGDANTKFFHSKASSRRKKNSIRTLTKDGNTFTLHEEKEQVLYHLFTMLLGTACPTLNSFD